MFATFVYEVYSECVFACINIPWHAETCFAHMTHVCLCWWIVCRSISPQEWKRTCGFEERVGEREALCPQAEGQMVYWEARWIRGSRVRRLSMGRSVGSRYRLELSHIPHWSDLQLDTCHNTREREGGGGGGVGRGRRGGGERGARRGGGEREREGEERERGGGERERERGGGERERGRERGREGGERGGEGRGRGEGGEGEEGEEREGGRGERRGGRGGEERERGRGEREGREREGEREERERERALCLFLRAMRETLWGNAAYIKLSVSSVRMSLCLETRVLKQEERNLRKESRSPSKKHLALGGRSLLIIWVQRKYFCIGLLEAVRNMWNNMKLK